MATLKLHRKQWVISSSSDIRYLDELNFKALRLNSGNYLHYDKDLSVTDLTLRDKSQLIILGVYFGKVDRYKDLDNSSGRYVTIHDGVLSLDPTDSLGVFYSTTKDSEIIATSSIVLASKISGLKLSGRNLQNKLINWDIVPCSRLPKVKRLMIGQGVDLVSRNIIDFDVATDTSAIMTIDEAANELSKLLFTLLKTTKGSIDLSI